MEAEVPIIDSHVHLWQPERFRMPWLDGNTLLNHSYDLETYSEQTRQWPLAGVIFVECGVEPHYALLEARRTVALAQIEPRLKGIVAAAPVDCGPQLRAYLEALVELGPQVKGVRRNLQDEQDPRLCLQPDFVNGVRLLADFQLSFDLCIRHWQLPSVTELVQLCPETQFVLDHFGKPAIQAGQLDPWRAQISKLAELPNVACKVSGLVTEANPASWQAEDLVPFISHVLQVFGEDRVLFGSDWPVVLVAATCDQWFQALQAATTGLSEGARRKLWNENARRVYRLSSSDEPASDG